MVISLDFFKFLRNSKTDGDQISIKHELGHTLPSADLIYLYLSEIALILSAMKNYHDLSTWKNSKYGIRKKIFGRAMFWKLFAREFVHSKSFHFQTICN